jgi:hypothetical protein
MLRDAGVEVDYIRQASRHTEVILVSGDLYRVPFGNHPSHRFERSLRSFIRKLSKSEAPL